VHAVLTPLPVEAAELPARVRAAQTSILARWSRGLRYLDWTQGRRLNTCSATQEPYKTVASNLNSVTLVQNLRDFTHVRTPLI